MPLFPPSDPSAASARPSLPAAALAGVCALALALPLTACGPAASKAPTDPLSRRIESFTGAHSKLVWSRYVGNKSDVYASYNRLQLWGVDTRDGRGIRPILKKSANYARPMILPDGSGIVFSQKGTREEEKTGRKHFDPVIKRVDWNGETVTDLGPGFAVEVWRDPATGTDWVYATDLSPTDRASTEGTRIERFPLDRPDRRERVWDKTRVSTENIQLSRDGNRASCLFPWPDSGVLNLETRTHQKYQHGCWPSLAPDNSYLAWVFDGSHKNLHLFTDRAEQTWTVPVNTAPGMGRHEMYHPRWSNHPRYFCLTGPYDGPTPNQSETDRVEILVGRFSSDLRSVEDWLQVTDDRSSDLFPDLWIAGGDTVSVEPPRAAGSAGKTAKAGTAAEAGAWPAGEGPYLFLWEHRDAANAVDGSGSRVSSVEAKGLARFGAHFEMIATGGSFVPDPASTEAVMSLKEGGPFTVEALLTPEAEQQAGTLLASPAMVLRQDGDRLGFGLPGQGLQDLGPVSAGTSTHVAVVFDGNALRLYRDGAPVAAADQNAAASRSPAGALAAAKGSAGPGTGLPDPLLQFGGGWSGSLEGIAIRRSAVPAEVVAATAARWKAVLAARKPIPTVRLRGKLVEITPNRPVEALDTYQRALLAYRYEVEEVIAGEFPDREVAVMHWTILDRTPLPGFPREIGKRYEMTLQPYAAHPELVSERQWNDLLDPLEPWFDLSPPGTGGSPLAPAAN